MVVGPGGRWMVGGSWCVARLVVGGLQKWCGDAGVHSRV